MKEEESAQSPAPRCVKVQFCAFAEQIDEEELDSALEAERGRSSFMKRSVRYLNVVSPFLINSAR